MTYPAPSPVELVRAVQDVFDTDDCPPFPNVLFDFGGDNDMTGVLVGEDLTATIAIGLRDHAHQMKTLGKRPPQWAAVVATGSKAPDRIDLAGLIAAERVLMAYVTEVGKGPRAALVTVFTADDGSHSFGEITETDDVEGRIAVALGLALAAGQPDDAGVGR